MTENTINTLTLDGTEHQIDEFSPRVKELVLGLQDIEADSKLKQYELAKVQALHIAVVKELTELVKKELDEKDTAALYAGVEDVPKGESTLREAGFLPVFAFSNDTDDVPKGEIGAAQGDSNIKGGV